MQHSAGILHIAACDAEEGKEKVGGGGRGGGVGE